MSPHSIAYPAERRFHAVFCRQCTKPSSKKQLTTSHAILLTFLPTALRHICGLLVQGIPIFIPSYSFTTYMWSSRTRDSYISFCLVYLTSDFDMQSVALENKPLHLPCIQVMQYLNHSRKLWKIYILGKNVIVRHTKIPHFLGFSACAAFFGIWRSAGAFFALSAMRAHFFQFIQHIFGKIAPCSISVILTQLILTTSSNRVSQSICSVICLGQQFFFYII